MEKKLKQQPAKCIKVVLFGPESTGKTILAKALSAHYNTLWVPEYSRLYAEEKAKNKEVLTKKDVLPIAEGQMLLENKMSKKAKDLLICDTDLLETKVYSETYYDNYCPKDLHKFALENYYNLYFLTNIDIPWQADGIRDKPNDRDNMFQAFKSALITFNKPFVLLNGNLQERLSIATKHIDELLKNSV